MKPESKKFHTQATASCFDLTDLSQALKTEEDERTIRNNRNSAGVYDFSEVSKALISASAVEFRDKTIVEEIARAQRLYGRMRLRLQMKKKLLAVTKEKDRRRNYAVKLLFDMERNGDKKVNNDSKKWKQLKITDILSLESLTLKDDSAL